MNTVNGSSREYTLTGLEENSNYTINVTAMNGTGSSPPATTTARTAIAGRIHPCSWYEANIHHDMQLVYKCHVLYTAAPSASPVDLMVSSTSPTSISLSWGEVPCVDRNVDRITGYQIVTRTTSDNVIRDRERDHSTRMFTATHLIPRTSYTFEVNARYDVTSPMNPIFGPAAVITEVTEVPRSKSWELYTKLYHHDPTAVGFFLRGVLYPNNSVVSLTDIGEGYNALHCLTNLTTCCRGADGGSAGEWFLPGKTSPVVDISSVDNMESFTRSKGPSAVLLNRRTGAMGPTGLFTCQVPDGSGTNRTLYIGVDLSMQHALR